jgi:hypothetical protein
MLVDSPFVGEWMGSAYTSRGKRVDEHLVLNADGTFERQMREMPDFELIQRGIWQHTKQREGQELIALQDISPAQPGECSEMWRVLSVTTCEHSNCLMALRRVIFAGRNLPVLFYRVHP